MMELQLFYKKIYPCLSTAELEAYIESLSKDNKDLLKLVYLALECKKQHFDCLTDKELMDMANDNESTQGYMRRTEDFVLTTSKENIRGFYEQWESIEFEYDCLKFELQRRKLS